MRCTVYDHLGNAVIDVHGSAPHAQGLSSFALLGHSLSRELRVVCELAQLLHDCLRDVVLVKLKQAFHEARLP